MVKHIYHQFVNFLAGSEYSALSNSVFMDVLMALAEVDADLSTLVHDYQ
jgi:hypothetical protein